VCLCFGPGDGMGMWMGRKMWTEALFEDGIDPAEDFGGEQSAR